MGSIREFASNRTLLLEPEHFIGRVPTCALRLGERHISGQHALIRWTGDLWELKDLGSRNGTFLDGVRLGRGSRPLRVGSVIAFGKPLERRWEMTDDSAPQVMAVPIDGGDPVLLEGDLLALPSNDDPGVTIYRSPEGVWVIEQPDESIAPITNLQTFDVAGRGWRFCCAEKSYTTVLAVSPGELEVRHLQLSFSVSRDEEHVQLHMTCGGRVIDMGTRAHNYLLLTLARRRLQDAGEALAETTCGWVYQDDLAHDPTMAPPQLNIDVFRIRKQFAAIGVIDAANIVERRPRTRQLRIGTGRLSIAQL